ncbi:hypothetical protein [Pseudoroseicyclus sp. CXY001]|uniref:hypothetical protein n=1 Tax=Pseudoroseicyclus sp. CXY001 TaxID=3242492 RepID=UPI0035712A3E
MRALSLLLLLPLLAACDETIPATAPAEATAAAPASYPFVGAWNCQGFNTRISATTYTLGNVNSGIAAVSAGPGESYTLSLANGNQVQLANVTASSMTNGDFACERTG